ncbi:MAG: hypothetical protein ACREEE_05410 [Dongiaceae bacterium]
MLRLVLRARDSSLRFRWEFIRTVTVVERVIVMCTFAAIVHNPSTGGLGMEVRPYVVIPLVKMIAKHSDTKLELMGDKRRG